MPYVADETYYFSLAISMMVGYMLGIQLGLPQKQVYRLAGAAGFAGLLIVFWFTGIQQLLMGFFRLILWELGMLHY